MVVNFLEHDKTVSQDVIRKKIIHGYAENVVSALGDIPVLLREQLIAKVEGDILQQMKNRVLAKQGVKG